MKAIEFDHFTKRYGNFTAVKNLCLSVESGTMTGFVGKNGAGKTTTIRTMLNFLHPSEGSVRIFGHDSVRDSAKIKEITGYMSADSAFYDKITCAELLRLNCSICGTPWEQAHEYLSYFELDGHKKINELSLGNRKKVGIIQALLKPVKLLILDEPTSGLDPFMQKKFFELLQRLQKEGVTIFLSSHQLEEIETYCDRAVILKDGVVVEDIDMTKARAQRRQSVIYTLADGTQESFDYTGDVNDLVARLAKLDLSRLEIRDRTVSEEFLKYYEGDET